MALVLAIDIRNTRTRIGLALDGRLVSQWAVPTDPDETADGAVACVLGFFDALARGLAPIEEGAPGAIDLPESAPLADGAIIASVIPALTGVWADAARRLTDARPLTVGPGLKTGLKMNFSDPVAVGADRVAEMVGAKSTYGAPALVIDLGTSTTFELLDEAGAFRGGIIAPGMKLGAPGAGPRGRPAGRRGASSPQVAARPHHRRGHAGGHRHGGGGPHRRPHRYDLGRLPLHDPRRHPKPSWAF